MRQWVACLVILCPVAAFAAFTPTNTPVHGGNRAVCDLPTSQHMRNTGGSDGAGLCVFTSIEMSSRWQNVSELMGFQQWMTQRPGGGWPEKLDQMITEFARSKGVSSPRYIQHTGGDERILDLAIQTDRMPCVTYAGRDDFYRHRIAHMVCLAHLDADKAAIIDNNRPGVWVWMTRQDFLTRWRDMQGGWAVVLLNPPPPPHPEMPVSLGDDVWNRVSVGSSGPCGPDCWCDPCRCRVVVGQCPGGVCPVPSGGQMSAAQPPTPDHYWGFFPELGMWGWRLKDRSAVVPVPVARPYGEENYGVDSSRIHTAPRYSINGVEVTRPQAMAALAGADGPLADDSDRWHLTAVGDPAFLGRVRQDVAALPAELRNRLLFQAYSPDHWAVSQFKLSVGVSLRKPSPVRVAPDVGVIPAGEYSAARLSDLLAEPGGPAPRLEPRPGPLPTPVPRGPDWSLWAAVIVLIAILFFRKR